MTILSRYSEIVTPLVGPYYGCIPWAIEWMIRYKGNVSGSWEIPPEELDVFQYQFNLEEQTNGDIRNNYENLLEMIREFYPSIGLVRVDTYQSSQAAQKYQHIERLIGQGIPCITTIRLLPQDNAHIVPVVEVHQNDVIVIWNNISFWQSTNQTDSKNLSFSNA